ncbi:MAG: 50S ribosomal protein L25 [Waddliaceae bacterium]|nr:50S ribosomal protein L25 [Waddliaceae bacterium]MBT3579319.1 50S ribosomal protein L25 [Waddliaceae bacterium]MBT4445450.1 50S ribosomal protein L25 [Waddliaceae bacterium]MBT6928575.1 50S ribosomal protein L25 [Waddliaceae bacterium]MBT7264900.1 50S ribosomal protein L25 [Waddliaceae bacterium]
MKLSVTKRAKATKKEAKRFRREGNIPAVIYSTRNDAENIVVDGEEFATAMRAIEKGGLPTTTFTLTDGEGKERRAVVKDIQYHITSYDILHLDFVELFDDVTVRVNVPIRFKGVEKCEGIKLGGVLRSVIRYCNVSCLPADIPQQFVLDVSKLAMTQSLRLRDIAFSKGVKPLSNVDEVAVVIAKR